MKFIPFDSVVVFGFLVVVVVVVVVFLVVLVDWLPLVVYKCSQMDGWSSQQSLNRMQDESQ